MDQEDVDDWDLEDRDHRATLDQNVTVYCQSGHGGDVEMRPVEDEVFECPECGAVVRIEIVST